MKRILPILVLLGACTAPEPVAPVEAPPSSPQRVIAFAPSITEFVFAFGQGHRVVGISSFCTYPPKALDLPVVGGMMDPNLERITALNPDLIMLPGDGQKVAELADQRGIPTVNAFADSLATIEQAVANMGAALDCEPEAAALWDGIQADLDAVHAAVADRPRFKVLLIASRTNHDLHNLFSIGGPSFVSELLDLVGGDNILADLESPYPEASKETIVVREPDVIIEFHAGETLTESDESAYIADWNELGTLPAVRNKRIHLIADDYALLPGPRITLTARRLAEALHPGLTIP
jgi:cobalamin transport system substrate-binding protein